jgi:hypothetical protein
MFEGLLGCEGDYGHVKASTDVGGAKTDDPLSLDESIGIRLGLVIKHSTQRFEFR